MPACPAQGAGTRRNRTGGRRATEPADAARLRHELLAWFADHARRLPWRTRRNAYRVWVSEVMLQQTRADVVARRYDGFLQRFPTLAALAAATEAEVLAAWSGLGYYRRARLLHAGSRYVVAHHGGRVPRQRDALLAVPGVGRYTAAAILSIAHGQRLAALDANVVRVCARLLGIRDPRPAATYARVAALAEALVDHERPGDVNEALMDLGSSLCTARSADCDACPLALRCAGAKAGDAVTLAGAVARARPRDVRLACAVVRRGEGALLLRRDRGEALLGGMWELPTVEPGEGDDVPAMLAELVRRRARVAATFSGPAASVRHAIVGRRIVADVYVAEGGVRWGRSLPDGACVADAAERSRLALPALPVRILDGPAPPARRRSRATRAGA